jgi:hypothetical protein
MSDPVLDSCFPFPHPFTHTGTGPANTPGRVNARARSPSWLVSRQVRGGWLQRFIICGVGYNHTVGTYLRAGGRGRWTG